MGGQAPPGHREQGFVLKKPLVLRVADVAAVLADVMPEPQRWLGPGDAARWAAMGSPRRKEQFVAGRWLARHVVAAFTGTETSAWQLATAANGAADMAWLGTGTAPRIHLSLSHSAGKIAVAVAGFPLGIDIESTAKARDWIALAEKVFVAGECEWLRTSPAAERADLFHSYWTLREAARKQDGSGLRLGGGGAGCARECDEAVAVAATWRFDGYCMAVAGVSGMYIEAEGMPAIFDSSFWRFDDP